MSEELEEGASLSRRGMIKRGALVGGTLVWAQPVVQGFGTAAGAQSAGGSPLSGFSYVAAVIYCPDGTFAVKYELDAHAFVDPGNQSNSGNKGLPQCWDDGHVPESWTSAGSLSGTAAAARITVSQSGSTLTLTLKDPNCTFSPTGVLGAIKHGQDCDVYASGGGSSISFDLSQLDPQGD